ncbi:MAG: hypothetical protein LAO30_15855 [Acidobacteriia bacterium]|nr:hypothetical protein [Terriglobia bacterium]
MKKKRSLGLLLLLLAVVAFVPLTRNQRFAAYRTVDVVQLLGSGACLGVGLTLVVFSLRKSSD